MNWLKRAAMLIAVIAVAAIAAADQWNDRTTIKIDKPMLVPGATLPPGTYTFKLADSKSSRHIVQIWNEDQTKLIATTNAVPIKRAEVSGDVVLKVNPTDASAGAPAAIKAWFYPGSRYGHEFIYPERQARDIAQRTKTLVLSSDMPNSDMQGGTIYTYDANGQKGAWKRDDQMIQEWNTWNEEGRRTASARTAAPGNAGRRESTTPMVRSQPAGTNVRVGDLEENPQKYAGQTITVTAEVDEVFGPRLFKIDEPNWGDLDGEVLVYLPSNLAALVREDDRVTVSGTMKSVLQADLEPELGWLEPDPDIEVEFARRPVLFANRIVGGNSDVALSIEVNPGGGSGDTANTATHQSSGKAPGTTSGRDDEAVGTSGTSALRMDREITDLSTISKGSRDLVGRRVNLDDVKVARRGTSNGFWVASGGTSVFVLPVNDSAKQSSTSPSVGQSVSIDGMVLQMPRRLRDRADAVKDGNDQIYIYATSIK